MLGWFCQWVGGLVFALPQLLSRVDGGGVWAEHCRGAEGGWCQAVQRRGTERELVPCTEGLQEVGHSAREG